ncbi:MAG: Slp family lipoprotein [Chromatiales bacterium]|nr:Slp family lipoprotein [Chromatiales bacterium]
MQGVDVAHGRVRHAVAIRHGATYPGRPGADTRAGCRGLPEEDSGTGGALGRQNLESRNLADRTEITVLTFPIDSSGAPQTEDDVVIGRFVAVQSGYLETTLYTPGREITVYGQVEKPTTQYWAKTVIKYRS